MTSIHKFAVDALAAKNNVVVSGARDRIICVWDLASGKAQKHWRAHEGKKEHEGWITSVAINPSATEIYSVAADGYKKYWDKDGKQLTSVRGDWEGSRTMSLAKNTDLLVSTKNSYAEDSISLWTAKRKTRTGKVPLEETVNKLTVSDDSTTVIASDLYGGFAVINTPTSEILWSKREKEKSFGNSIDSIAISSNNLHAILGYENGEIEVWDINKHSRLNRFKLHSDSVSAVDISLDGSMACSASWDRSLKVWDIETGEQIAIFSSDDFWSACIFADDPLHIVASDERGTVHFLLLECFSKA